MPPEGPPGRFGAPGNGFAPPSDPFSQHPGDHDPLGGGGGPAPQVMMSNCKRPGCPNPVRMMSNSGQRMNIEYCSNDCLVEDNNKQMTNNPYANATNNWGPHPSSQQAPPPQQNPTEPQQQQSNPGSSPSSTNTDK